MAAEVASTELALEIEETQRRHFPKGLPTVLSHRISLFMMGPVFPPAEGLVKWWEGARKNALKMNEVVKQAPERYQVPGEPKAAAKAVQKATAAGPLTLIFEE
jgi:hypothetical protein